MLNEWLYKGNKISSIPEGSTSFVYSIQNLLNNKEYIGCKLFFFSKFKMIGGKKKRIFIESDWKDYWSSSEALKSDVNYFGKENFNREILYLCSSKSESKYLEAREQFDRRVLEHPERYYNGIINLRVSSNHIKKYINNKE